jgi:hypothetical protein
MCLSGLAIHAFACNQFARAGFDDICMGKAWVLMCRAVTWPCQSANFCACCLRVRQGATYLLGEAGALG